MMPLYIGRYLSLSSQNNPNSPSKSSNPNNLSDPSIPSNPSDYSSGNYLNSAGNNPKYKTWTPFREEKAGKLDEYGFHFLSTPEAACHWRLVSCSEAQGR